jgi:NAD(P)-dependent dehydrogenase (short-subunit alcohol dehydrogenase family)
MSELRFEGRVALVTGAGRGVGRAHALLLASRGAKVVVADYGGGLEGTGGESNGPADDVVAEIRAAGGEAVASYASVAELKGAASMVEAALDSFGKIDILINNAGISNLTLFEDLPIEDFRRQIDVHYMGTIYTIKTAWPHMVKARYGRIVNTCSEGSLGIHSYVTSYGGAKGAVYGLTRTLAAEAPFHGISVNAIAPRAYTRLGSEESVMKTFNMPREMVVGIIGMMPPELVSPAAIYFAHESCKLNGEVFVSGGGVVQRMTMQLSQGIHNPELTPEFVAENIDTVLNSASQIVEVNSELRMNA